MSKSNTENETENQTENDTTKKLKSFKIAIKDFTTDVIVWNLAVPLMNYTNIVKQYILQDFLIFYIKTMLSLKMEQLTLVFYQELNLKNYGNWILQIKHAK